MIAHFVAKAPYEGDPGSPAKIDIMIERWSTDKERDDLNAALSKSGPDGLLNVLQGMRRRAGVLMMPGVPGAGARARLRHPVNLYFARQIETANGRQVVAASDHVLALGRPTSEWPADFEFSLLDIRFDKNGSGVGKVAPPAGLVENKSTKTLEAKDYGSLPARLIDVKSDKP